METNKNTVWPPQAGARSNAIFCQSASLRTEIGWLLNVYHAAVEVASRGWGTSVSECYHFSRLSSMARLRAALEAPLPPSAAQQNDVTGTADGPIYDSAEVSK